MRILHTADWHIGKRLHNIDLNEDHQLFFDWLLNIIEEQKVDLLLISGDVFDLANPSSEARRLYYSFLVNMTKTKCKVIVTGGNHDSPSVLNAPKELLKALDIDVVGGMPANPEEALIPVGDHELIIAAVPYLRDSDLRQFAEGESYEDKLEATRKGIENTYKTLAQLSAQKYPNVPAIAMGHLYTNGATTSDSEREIQIGNLAAFHASQFDSYFKYIALGHIHKPQQITSEQPVYFSGSPIALSFSEQKDEKRILILDFDGEQIELESIPVPKFRSLSKISGTLTDIKTKLENYTSRAGQLQDLAEVEMIEEHYDPGKVTDLEQFLFNYENEALQVIKHRISFQNKVSGTAQLFTFNQHIEDIKPIEVFEKRLEKEELDPENKQLLIEAFHEILELVQSPDA